MFKLLIADDDMIIRMDVRMLLDWNKLGIELLDDAVNGRDVLRRVQEFNPDILVLDLGMPMMSGIEVIRELKEKQFQCKIIILSCHDDFDNVKEAMMLGVSDYILKHMLKAETLEASVNKVLEGIHKDNREKEEKKKQEQLALDNILEKNSAILKDLIFGYCEQREEIINNFNQLGLDSEIKKLAVLVMEVDDLSKLKSKYKTSQHRMLLQSVGEFIVKDIDDGMQGFFINMEEGKYCVVLGFKGVQSYFVINNQLFQASNRIQDNIRKYLNISTTIGISKIFNDLTSVSDAYGQAELALEGKLYLGKNRVIHFSEIENYSNEPHNIASIFEQELYSILMDVNADLNKFLDGMFVYIRNQEIKVEYMRQLGFELLTLTSRMASDFHIEYERIFGCEYLPYRKMQEFETLDEIKQWFAEVCSAIFDLNKSKQGALKTSERNEIRKAVAYIENNYMNNFTLQDISDYCNLSRAYFSNLFKEETGENYTKYLNRIRIKKSKQLLLNTDLKIYEIAENCGFSDYRYFSRFFKEQTGSTPADYRTKGL